MPFDGKDFLQPQNDVLDLLRRGRERVAQGWCQNALRKGTAYCAVGAIAYDGIGYPVGAMTALASALPDALRVNPGLPPPGAVVKYNNAPERTQADILELFDRAIVAWEKNNAIR